MDALIDAQLQVRAMYRFGHSATRDSSSGRLEHRVLMPSERTDNITISQCRFVKRVGENAAAVQEFVDLTHNVGVLSSTVLAVSVVQC